MTQNDATIHQQPDDSHSTTAYDGWIVTCPKCKRNYLVMRPQIMNGSWQRCPFCRDDDEPEAT